jgi:hypothetical protein
MIERIKTPYLAAFLATALLSASCAPGMHLDTRNAMESDVKGNYRVIFFGCNFFNDLETIVLLQKEDSRYTFEPYAPDFQYSVTKDIPAHDALASAEKFVKCNASFHRAELSSILAPDGTVLGYEVRPLYLPLTYGLEDVLDTNYFIKGDKVVATIRLVPAIAKKLQGGTDQGKDR